MGGIGPESTVDLIILTSKYSNPATHANENHFLQTFAETIA